MPEDGIYVNMDGMISNFKKKIETLQKDRKVKVIEREYIIRLRDQQVNSITGDIENIDFNIERQEEAFRKRCRELRVNEEAINRVIYSMREK